jgi:acyl-CoA ligase (AMP-forming) (exosortase A-associated)
VASLVHELIDVQATRRPGATALLHREETVDYASLAGGVRDVAATLRHLGLRDDERVAVYLPKQVEAVLALFGAAAAGGVFVPINPLLKPAQVAHILQDCGVRVLVTSADRAALLAPVLGGCGSLAHLLLTDGAAPPLPDTAGLAAHRWQDVVGMGAAAVGVRRIDADMAAILYTSGSTGRPKGVVLSHRNLVAGAESVVAYLGNTADDRVLALLPLSFDYGLSQLTTMFRCGGSAVLLEFLLPCDVTRAVARYAITGIAGVPPLWHLLADADWSPAAARSLRYLTNSGGVMPVATTRRLRSLLPQADIVLMYGLTEAFRSTFLPPGEVDRRPDSIGQAIPNADVRVLRPDGSECDIDEPGELVHRGVHVALGYWGDPALTARRFRPAPLRPPGQPGRETAVWSGDIVRRDADGYLYFVARADDQIKVSGYRVNPAEIEEAASTLEGIELAVAFGVPDPRLGQAIVLVVQSRSLSQEAVLAHCRAQLPQFMLPSRIEVHAELPRNPNGKIDRSGLAAAYRETLAAQ